MAKAVIIKVSGDKEVVEFQVGKSYELLSKSVGGMIECISLTNVIGQPDMWINEEGKIIGLEQNPMATALWFDMYGASDVILGDIIITGGADEEGETLGLSDEQVDYFMGYASSMFYAGGVSLS